jgi:predicted Fe-S protein YdhL (DUF1289 family)
MDSPCTGCCYYDHDKGHCTACFRTLKEIGCWKRMTDEQKRKALEGAAERSATRFEPVGT